MKIITSIILVFFTMPIYSQQISGKEIIQYTIEQCRDSFTLISGIDFVEIENINSYANSVEHNALVEVKKYIEVGYCLDIEIIEKDDVSQSFFVRIEVWEINEKIDKEVSDFIVARLFPIKGYFDSREKREQVRFVFCMQNLFIIRSPITRHVKVVNDCISGFCAANSTTFSR